MTSVLNSGEELFIEWLVEFRDKDIHINQILSIIDIAKENQKTIIVFGSPFDIDLEMVNLFNEYIRKSNKNIKIILLKMNYELNGVLEKLSKVKLYNLMHEIQIITEVDNLFTDSFMIENISEKKITKAIKSSIRDMDYDSKVLFKILKKLRSDVGDVNPNVYRYKDIEAWSFDIGFNKDALTFRVGINKRGKKIYGKLQCYSKPNRKYYYYLYEFKDLIDKEGKLVWNHKEKSINIVFSYDGYILEESLNQFISCIEYFLRIFTKRLSDMIS